MTPSNNRRCFLEIVAKSSVLASAGGLVMACTEVKPAFAGIDLTGADYAQGFQLPDQNGQTRTLKDFAGKLVVVFFGYTQCPDVCPTSLTELAEAKRLLGAQGDRLQGVFVSVDPERDTPDLMKLYMASFDPSFVALHATPEQLVGLAQSFKVYYKKVAGSAPGTYTMDHSAGSYVYDTKGRIRLYHRYGSGAQALAADLKILLTEKG
jgi:protein SCO1